MLTVVLPPTALMITNVLVLTGAGGPRAAIGLPVALILPGALTLRLLGISRRGWEWLLHAVAFSLVALMVAALPLALIGGRALSPAGCLAALDTLILLLAVAAVRRPAHRFADGRTWRLPGLSGAAPIACGAAAVALAVAGARRLNEGGGPALTEMAFGLAAAALLAAAGSARRGRPGAAAAGLYLAALTVLFATSLRGAGVSGHDIKIEYRVLVDVLRQDAWRPGGPFSGFNSCLSLTVLPAFLSRLLGVAALDVYRVCFQTVFALVPVATFLYARRLLPAGGAVLAGGVFVAFPAFVNDMPMINRQEIALVFLSVAALNLRCTRDGYRRRATVLAVMGAGMTVSHYTTTYVAIALLVTAWSIRRVRRRWIPPGRAAGWGRPALALVAMAVAWAVLTGSAPAFAASLGEAATSVTSGRSAQTGANQYAPVAAGRAATDEEVFARYVGMVRRSSSIYAVSAAPPGCRARVQPSETARLTAAGATMARLGVEPGAFNRQLRLLLSSGLFQGGAVLGCALLWWWLYRSRRPRPTAGVHAELSAAGLVVLSALLVAPQLGDSYGLLRLYQQILLPFAPLIILALTWPATRLTGRARAAAGAAVHVVVLGCLLAMVGLVPQLTGGYVPQLNLNNTGPYYRAAYASSSDVATMAWVRRTLPRASWVVSDDPGTSNLRAMTALFPEEGLVPGALPAAANLVLLSVHGNEADAVTLAGDRVLNYRFPLHCVTAGRPLLYANGPSRVYGPEVNP
ncbi:hypothetical protein [Actinoplanes sp. GCM10030250]|uniref:hypothetical protein n=1 Tax=Actinoplanes sp. GCM10030250 TaxID=3273376 RepID=UPI003623E539